MMSREEMIDSFRTNDGNGFETIRIETHKDGTRSVMSGRYFYNPGADEYDEDGKELSWRVVDEYVTIDLNKFIDAVSKDIHLSNLDEFNDRPNDDIGDLTEDQAIEMFKQIINIVPFIEKKDITKDTPDGDYLTQLF